MKLDFILPEVDKVSVPSENEVQGQLRGVLTFWGEDGSMWRSGGWGFERKSCYIGACNNTGAEWHRFERYSQTAARELGFTCSVSCSDSGFDNARKMVLRAIELAA